MKWQWRGKEEAEDKSGIFMMEFHEGVASIEFSDFRDALHLANLIEKEMISAELRGATKAVDRFAKLGRDMIDRA